MCCALKPEHKVLSLEEHQKDRDLVQRIQLSAAKYGIGEVLMISTKDICVAEWVQLKCKYGCKRFGKSWCCPPETPAPEQSRLLLNEYKKALVLCGNGSNTEFYKNNSQKRRKQVLVWKGTVAIERELFLSEYYRAFALVAENCALCKECLYPHDCKFPNDRRPSVESLSIDVFQTLKNVGKKFRLAKTINEKHNYYSIILLE
jgi:predicted metal-binding protein